MEYKYDGTGLPPPFEKRKEVRVVFFDVTDKSPRDQFVLCCLAVFVLYLAYGFLQELIFTQQKFKSFGWYITLIQFAFYTVFAKLECILFRKSERRVSLRIYSLLAFLTLGTMGLSNSSLMYLNYPTQVIFKCCKLIPVMIGSILIQNKKYKCMDFIAALCMCVGLSYFTLADSGISPTFSLIGVCMISCALVCDAAIGNVQEKYMKANGASNTEVILYSYSIGFVYLLFVLLLTGDLKQGIHFSSEKPVVFWYTMWFSLTGYLGVQVVLTLVTMSGALVAVTITTCRKAVSIIVSFVFFTKPFTIHYVWAGLIVILGIYLNLASKNVGLQSSLKKFIHSIKLLILTKRPEKSIETTV
ncbi:adenosine 3'-phospho 5'-phosphosulfate transporter 2 [Cimex lectularius]|uniref:Adenosine 3'-phospho 5'-phosphosulfate transporter 2 n=1 Tax=Cimex lectularius TaxID=79782 RepID=A0A8I6RN15_CIMLE|nr:adenosine 3'-phospho 5'-phosphosulfate transporter 2 [Cimex lectularius]